MLTILQNLKYLSGKCAALKLISMQLAAFQTFFYLLPNSSQHSMRPRFTRGNFYRHSVTKHCSILWVVLQNLYQDAFREMPASAVPVIYLNSKLILQGSLGPNCCFVRGDPWSKWLSNLFCSMLFGEFYSWESR